MLFNTFTFYVFLLAVLGLYLVMPGRRARAAWLLAASYFFYGYWDWRFLSLLAVTTLVDFSVGRALASREGKGVRRRWLLLSCFVNLGMLGFFKYFNFFAGSAQSAAFLLGLHLGTVQLRVILPVGISFYVLRSLSYTIDVYRRRLEPTRSLLDYALFVAFFPNLVAGPIDRAPSLLPQFARLGRPARRQVAEGLVLISLGLFKKVLIGDAAGRIVDEVFGQPQLYRSPELLSALLLFSIQVYADFAGYSNIARGVAKLFGVELMRNFEQPYLSRSFSEFWRRWHISLSSWIWDYLFGPIMAASLRRVARFKLQSVKVEMALAYPPAVLGTMLLCGLWHGAGFTYIIWGGLHGLFLAGERLLVYRGRTIVKRARVRRGRDLGRIAAGLLSTQLLVVFAWLFFRSSSLAEVGYFLHQFVHWQGSDLAGRFAVIVLTFGAVLLALDVAEYATQSELYLLRLRPALAAGICAAVIIMVCLYMATNKPLPFVYFQF